jgi:hypothetical protein
MSVKRFFKSHFISLKTQKKAVYKWQLSFFRFKKVFLKAENAEKDIF